MSRHGRFWSLNIGICVLFVIWCLEFAILDTKLQGRAIISDSCYTGQVWPEDQVFNNQINTQPHL